MRGITAETAEADEHFYVARCTGTLTKSEVSISIAFSLECSTEGEVVLIIDKISITEEAFRFHDAFDESEPLRISGRTDAGQVVTSDAIYLTSFSTSTDDEGDWLALAAVTWSIEIASVAYDENAPAAGARASYYSVGLRGFQRLQTPTRLGIMYLVATSKIDNYNEVTGRIEVEAESASTLQEWLSNTDDVVFDVLDIISLAEGRLIRWCVCRVSIGADVFKLRFRGPRRTGRPRRALFHWLNLQPVLELAVRRYTPQLKERTGIHVAIEWSLMNPRYSELDFVACMTALEHLAQVYEANHGKSSPGRDFFNNTLEPAILNAIEDVRRQAKSPEEISAVDKAVGKIRDLTRISLKDSIERMLRGYAVPLAGIEGALQKLINLRNQLVHRGIAVEEPAAIQQQIEIVHELLTRIFLTLLAYSGQYSSYLKGRNFISFPPPAIDVPVSG